MATVVVITSGTTYTIPADFTSLVSVEAIGAGGNGSTGLVDTIGGAGGGGGAYAKTFTVSGISAGAIFNIQIGTAGGTTGSGATPTANTWFNNASTLVAAGGTTPASGLDTGSGGSAANSVGVLKYPGGDGSQSFSGFAGSGGGGAAGPNGVGTTGFPGDISVLSVGTGVGGGGGGSDGGSNGTTGSGSGNGGNNPSGTGGGAGAVYGSGNPGAAGTDGGGGGGGAGSTGVGDGTIGGDGSTSLEWENTYGSGGGGGGGGAGAGVGVFNGGNGGNGGSYGGGGGGFGSNGGGGTGVRGSSGTGGQGLIIFTYNTTTSLTSGFSPSTGEIGLTALGRVGVKRTAVTVSHMAELRNAANFLLSEWSNQTPNLWVVDLISVPLVAGTATYDVPAETVMILDMYISYGTPNTDRLIFPISRSEYAAYPDKTTQAIPTVFWFDRLIAPTFTLWPVPDSASTYTANYYSVRQTYTAELRSAGTPEIPYRFLEAFTAGLAWKLSEIYAPQLEDKLFARYQRAWGIAATQDVENVPFYITPGIGGYFDY